MFNVDGVCNLSTSVSLTLRMDFYSKGDVSNRERNDVSLELKKNEY